MAKSFYTILKEGVLEVNHKGDDVTFKLPKWLVDAAECLENEFINMLDISLSNLTRYGDEGERTGNYDKKDQQNQQFMCCRQWNQFFNGVCFVLNGHSVLCRLLL